MKAKTLQPLRAAIKQNDTKAVEDEIRRLHSNPQFANLTELAKAKRWLAARALIQYKFVLAQEMFRPFESAFPLSQALMLPDMTETELAQSASYLPNWTELSLALAYRYWQTDDFGKAAQILAHLAETVENNSLGHAILELYCDCLARLGEPKHLKEIKIVCKPIATPEQTYRYPFLYLGAAAFAATGVMADKGGVLQRLFTREKARDNLLVEAMQMFKQAAQRPEGLLPMSSGCLSVFEMDSQLLANSVSEDGLALAGLSFDEANDHQVVAGQPVLFFACDSVYLRKYALVLVASVANQNAAAICHVHIVDPEEDSFGIVAEIRQLIPQVRLNVSFERLDSPQKTSYYANARFVRALELMDLYHAPLFIVDTNIIIEISMAGILNMLDACDVGLILVDKAPLPWLQVQSEVAYFSDSKNSRRFLELAKRFILAKLKDSSSEALGYVDQNALFSVFTLMQDELTVCNLQSPPQKTIFSCYSKTVIRQQFVAAKLAEFGISPPEPKVRNKTIVERVAASKKLMASASFANGSAEPSPEAAVAVLAENMSAAAQWFEQQGRTDAAREEAVKVWMQWRKIRKIIVEHGLISKAANSDSAENSQE